jgi:hypothetical protein
MFDRETIHVPGLSPKHIRTTIEQSVGPVTKLVENLLSSDPVKLTAFRREFDTLAAHFFEENAMRLSCILTRAIKN